MAPPLLDEQGLAILAAHLSPLSGEVVVLDMSAVEYIDSMSLRLIVQTQRRLTEEGGGLVLRNPSHIVMRLLEITGLDRHFFVEP